MSGIDCEADGAGEAASQRSRFVQDENPIGDAQEEFWRAISEFGHLSAEAMVAQLFLAEVRRRVASGVAVEYAS